ncbi:membrane protein FAM174-like [Ptychodera flava]|uniref:membrane protein FAM174-like n=1 Tax=Ptychodera flava TaxID=63121 RepID=UPI003969DD78
MKNFYIVLGTLLLLHTISSEAGPKLNRSSREDDATDVEGKTADAEQSTQKAEEPTNESDETQENGPNISTNKTGDPSGNNSGSTIPSLFNTNTDVVKRMMYVLVGVTGIVVVYFVFRAVRVRRRKSKSKKYGVLTTPGGDMEMAPLDQEDEEDDMTVFDVNNTR